MNIALLALSVTLLGTLITFVWRASATVSELKAALAAQEKSAAAMNAALEKKLAKVEGDLVTMTRVPLLEQRIELQDEALISFKSDFKQLRNAVYQLPPPMPRHGSRPDILLDPSFDEEPTTSSGRRRSR